MVRRHFPALSYLLLSLGAIALTFLPQVALAHLNGHANSGTLQGFGYDFEHGFGHPWSGLDHILAMLSVGLWASYLGGAAMYTVPCTFVGLMLLGGSLGLMQVPLPGVEVGILASDLILGALVMLGARLPLLLSATIVGGLALFHGSAHMSEMPGGGSPWGYALGFMLATALLHLLGIGMAIAAKKVLHESWGRVTGGIVLAVGLYVVLQAVLGF